MKIDKGWAGCALSHICLYEKFLSSNDKYMLVLEDDCIIIKSLPTTNSEVERMFNEVNSSIEEIDILYLTDRVYSLSFLNRRVIAGCGTEGYIITRSGARKALTVLRDLSVPIDIRLQAHFPYFLLNIFSYKSKYRNCNKKNANILINAYKTKEPYVLHNDDDDNISYVNS